MIAIDLRPHICFKSKIHTCVTSFERFVHMTHSEALTAAGRTGKMRPSSLPGTRMSTGSWLLAYERRVRSKCTNALMHVSSACPGRSRPTCSSLPPAPTTVDRPEP